MSGVPKRVLFVCVGNACRSQMAEAFARAYGADVLVPASAGISPGMYIPPDTLRAMQEKNLNLREHFPKSLRAMGRSRFDLIVNMTGQRLPAAGGANVVEWDVPDPVRLDYARHCEVRDLIERKVMELIVQFRRQQGAAG